MIQNFIKSWIPSGWFYRDLVIYGVIGLYIILMLFMVISGRKKEKSINRDSKATWSTITLIYVIFASFITIGVFGFGRHADLETESNVFYSESEDAIVSLVRTSVFNGRKHGITNYMNYFELISVNGQTGERNWATRAGWREYVIGTTEEFVVMSKTDKDVLCLLDINTGEVVYNKKKLEEKVPELKGQLSNEPSDYMVRENDVLIKALDNHYYQLNLDNFTLQRDDTAVSYFDARFVSVYRNGGIEFAREMEKIESIISEVQQELENQAAEDDWDIAEDDWDIDDDQLGMEEDYDEVDGKVKEELIGATIIDRVDKEHYYVFSYPKRQSSSGVFGLYQTSNLEYEWTVPLNIGENGKIEGVIITEDSIYIQSEGYLYAVDKDQEELRYTFNYRWNKIEE